MTLLSSEKAIIEAAYLKNTQGQSLSLEEKSIIEKIIILLDQGKIRVCEKIEEKWITHQWIKMAILLYFSIRPMEKIECGPFSFFDKIPNKQWGPLDQVRVVPTGLVRLGAFISPKCVLMPSYVNIGAYVGEGSMVDTWATVGSCAQIGKYVHLSGGVGIGGVLEPLQASPVIIEDHAFIGSRCIIVEGVIIEDRAIIGAGVTITASTKIIDVSGDSPVEYKGKVPSSSVVIPGTIQKEFPAGIFGVSCALIIGKRKQTSDEKTSLNETLRDFNVSV